MLTLYREIQKHPVSFYEIVNKRICAAASGYSCKLNDTLETLPDSGSLAQHR